VRVLPICYVFCPNSRIVTDTMLLATIQPRRRDHELVRVSFERPRLDFIYYMSVITNYTILTPDVLVYFLTYVIRYLLFLNKHELCFSIKKKKNSQLIRKSAKNRYNRTTHKAQRPRSTRVDNSSKPLQHTQRSQDHVPTFKTTHVVFTNTFFMYYISSLLFTSSTSRIRNTIMKCIFHAF
jgi:hypothetical protein